MKEFMGGDFLLHSETGAALFHRYAEQLPIIDYHCHINPQDIAEDRRFENLSQLWLGGNGYGDHYKWRLMRAHGVSERLITGDADDYDKFLAYAEVLPRAIGNPVHHWTHLELRRYFGCDLALTPDSAGEIWRHCAARLKDPTLSARGIIQGSNVVGIATTDDPLDSLEWHGKIAADPGFAVTVRPAWRPDRLLAASPDTFAPYIESLAALCGGPIDSMEALRQALRARMDHFDRFGCGASDHGLERIVARPATEAEQDAMLAALLAGRPLDPAERDAFQFALLRFFGREYAARGWVMEIHYGALRNLNAAGYRALGPDTGYDAIATGIRVDGLPALLGELCDEGALPKTILFSLDPGDNAMLNTVAGCFQREGVRGQVQQGAAWWFNDTLEGMRSQLTTFANTSLLGNFLGMVTDSRSLLSYPRHEYFRRILCDLLGGWAEAGEYPLDLERLGGLVRDISFYNTKEYFGF